MNEKKQNRILIADDEKEIRDILEILLVAEGYDVVSARDGDEVLKVFDNTFDLVMLDVNMPGKTGFAVGSELRQKSFVPMLFLTAYSQDSDKTMGYSAGGDDYITKPFSNSELLLRVKALLRRSQIYQNRGEDAAYDRMSNEIVAGRNPNIIVVGELCIDTDVESVHINGNKVILTRTEYKILELLITNRKKIFSIENIYNSVWEEVAVCDSAVMVHIKNLRKKIEKDARKPIYIKTAWGKGYYVD